MTSPPVQVRKRRLGVVVRSLPKSDRDPHENEDSVAQNLAAGRFAISDGASTSARSEVWSRLLTDSFAGGADPLAPQVLTELRQQWWGRVFHRSLAWFAQEKLIQGGAATFVGLQVLYGTYRMTAVGDSCLFHIREQTILLAAPLDRWGQFSRSPDLVSTRIDAPPLREELWQGGGEYREGDIFLLATDAVAKHLLRVYRERGALLPIPEVSGSGARFVDFVRRERGRGLDNDDTTVCVVTT